MWGRTGTTEASSTKNDRSRTSMQGSSPDRLQCGGRLLELCIESCADVTADLLHRVQQWPLGARKPIVHRSPASQQEAAGCLVEKVIQ